MDFIIIVTFNSQDFIEKCLRSLYMQEKKDFFVLVIDNASSDATVSRIKDFKNSCPGLSSSNFKLLALKSNIGFSRAVNYGVLRFLPRELKEIKGPFEHLILLNPDLFLHEASLKELTRTFEKKDDCGAAGGLITDYECSSVTHLGAVVSQNFITRHLLEEKAYLAEKEAAIRSVDYVTGAFFACRLELFVRLGGFDPGYRPAYFEELDFCLKLGRLGLGACANPGSRASHFECSSLSKFSPAFYYYYHKNRIRCAIINSGFGGLLRVFMPAELSWLKKKASRDQYKQLAKAYAVNVFFLPLSLARKAKNFLILRRIKKIGV
jgi:O-antigen biosynthesis protein